MSEGVIPLSDAIIAQAAARAGQKAVKGESWAAEAGPRIAVQLYKRICELHRDGGTEPEDYPKVLVVKGNGEYFSVKPEGEEVAYYPSPVNAPLSSFILTIHLINGQEELTVDVRSYHSETAHPSMRL